MEKSTAKPNKKIIWVHGTKGGVGKSLMCSVVIDYLLSKNITPAIIECDGSVPDVNARYENDVACVVSAMNDEESVYKTLEILQDVSDADAIDTIVVNLPANTELLDSIADGVEAVSDGLGYDNYVLFMIAENQSSADLAEKSLKDGLVSISKKSIAVINLNFGDSENDFAWFSSTAAKAWKKENTVMTLKPLKSRVKSYAEFENGAFSKMVNPATSKFKIIDQHVLKKWLKSAHEIPAAIFE